MDRWKRRGEERGDWLTWRYRNPRSGYIFQARRQWTGTRLYYFRVMFHQRHYCSFLPFDILWVNPKMMCHLIKRPSKGREKLLWTLFKVYPIRIKTGHTLRSISPSRRVCLSWQQMLARSSSASNENENIFPVGGGVGWTYLLPLDLKLSLIFYQKKTKRRLPWGQRWRYTSCLSYVDLR